MAARKKNGKPVRPTRQQVEDSVRRCITAARVLERASPIARSAVADPKAAWDENYKAQVEFMALMDRVFP